MWGIFSLSKVGSTAPSSLDHKQGDLALWEQLQRKPCYLSNHDLGSYSKIIQNHIQMEVRMQVFSEFLRVHFYCEYTRSLLFLGVWNQNKNLIVAQHWIGFLGPSPNKQTIKNSNMPHLKWHIEVMMLKINSCLLFDTTYGIKKELYLLPPFVYIIRLVLHFWMILLVHIWLLIPFVIPVLNRQNLWKQNHSAIYMKTAVQANRTTDLSTFEYGCWSHSWEIVCHQDIYDYLFKCEHLWLAQDRCCATFPSKLWPCFRRFHVFFGGGSSFSSVSFEAWHIPSGNHKQNYCLVQIHLLGMERLLIMCFYWWKKYSSLP
jgi:hypothetical protein